jgi:hypothetical protein
MREVMQGAIRVVRTPWSRRCGRQVGRVGFVDGIVQDVSGELAFVLLQVGEDLLGEFFACFRGGVSTTR